ncbi:MAG TPA: hypothetical protein PKO06_11525, partial [Candidatus Ozemobacteraceae bacterium]|nr:hypothetical protein [Candidatus Ozemobacteraceae bacterium]
MQSYARIVIPLLLIGCFVIPACAKKLGFEYSDGTQGPIEVVDLPTPKSPSRVFGLGEAMAAGKDVLLFRQVRKPTALKHMERNFFFISKLMESYEPTVKVIELSNSVSYPQGDYYADLMDYFPANGYGVVKKEGDGYKLYSSKFGYSEEYDTFVLPVKESIEQVLGPCPYDKKKLIKSTSCYEPYN